MERTGRNTYKNYSRAVWIWLVRHLMVAVVLLIAGAGLLVFSDIADEFVEGSLGPTDIYIENLVKSYRSPGFDAVAKILSDVFVQPYSFILVLPFLIYLAVKRKVLVAAGMGLVIFASLAVVSILKVIFGRSRPAGGLIPVTGYSFPSGHATLSMVIYGLLGYILWRDVVKSWWMRGIVLLVTCLLILGTGLSRIYLGVHYTSDVLAGWSAGLFILFGSIIFLEALHRREEAGREE